MVPAGRILVLLVVASSIMSLHGARAQTTGTAIVASDLELFSVGNTTGGGRVTWTLTGEQASLLRAKVLRMYDERPSIPPGFPFGGRLTEATPNGQVDSAEAAVFLDSLENQLEGIARNNAGTEFRFVLITRTDRTEADLPAERSTSGLVGTTMTSTEDLEIRFIFNARKLVDDMNFRQADEALVRALHEMFGFNAVGDLQADFCPPLCYPFPARGGWRVVGPPPTGFNYTGRFLWHGVPGATPWVDTGAYLDDALNVTFYSPNRAVEGTVDLRFASSAQLRFNHTGAAADGDVLLVQVSEDRIGWTNVTAVGDRDGNAAVDPLPIGTLGTSVYDLEPWLDREVYVRINFTANGDGTTGGPGYFLRDLQIEAPSTFDGVIDFRHIDFALGFLSFSDFTSERVRPHLIRLPVGEVMFYGATYESGNAPRDIARYATFDLVENPQILFAVLVVSAWLIRRLQDATYEGYRERHPVPVRTVVEKVKWLHRTGRIVVIALVVLYFFPTALIGTGFVVSGAVFWGLSVASLGAVTSLTMFWYHRRATLIPPEPTVPPEMAAWDLPPPPPPDVPPPPICAYCEGDIDAADLYRCTCGQLYHTAHAVELSLCVVCGRQLYGG